MTAQRDLAQAHAAFQSGDLVKAEALITAVLKDNPDMAKAHQLRALIARKANDQAAAEVHIKKALSLVPNDAECLNTYGNILRATGRTLEAINAYKQSLSAVPNYLQALQSLGELYLIEKDPLAAADVFRSGLGHFKDHPVLMRGLLFALKDSQQIDAAMDLIKQIPNAPDLALPAGQLFAMQGQYVQAGAAFRQALAHPQTALLAYRNLVQNSWMTNGYEAAEATIEQVISAAPNAGFAYIQGSDLLVDMGHAPEAMMLLDRCEAKFGPQSDIDVARANIAIERGEAEAALHLSEAALSKTPGAPRVMASYVRACLMNGEFSKALETARNVLTFVPHNQFWIGVEATALRGLGENYQRLYDYSKFVKAYDLEAPAEYGDIAEFLTQLKSALEARHDSQNHPMGQSLRQGTQTSADLRFAADRVLQDFFQALNTPIKDYMAHIGHDPDHPVGQRNTGKYRLTGAWSVRLHGGGFHVNHVHPEGWISSSFYVDVPDGTASDKDQKGWIKFGEPPFKVPDGSGGFMGAEHVIAPKAGRLVLFPSYMWHGTIPIDEGKTRMTLPFDAVPE